MLLVGMMTLARAESPDRADPFGPQVVWAPIIEIRGRLDLEGTPVPDIQTVGQVARVGLQAQRGILSARVSLQEVREWAANPQGTELSGPLTVELAEGWARLDGELSPNVGARLTIGRQHIQICQGRLVGRRDWDLEGQFLDAMRFELMAAPLSFELVNARRLEVDADEDPLSLGVTVLRLGVQRSGANAEVTLDLLSVVDARRTSVVTSTTGFFGSVAMGRVLGEGEGYLQQNPEGTGSLASGEFGYILGENRGWVVTARYTSASGDPGVNGLAAFQPVLGDTHDQYGLLDVLQPGDDSRGLADIAIRAEAQAGARVQITGQLHRLGSPLTRATYGYEADLSLTWHVTPYASVDLGGGVIAGGELGLRTGGYTQIAVAF